MNNLSPLKIVFMGTPDFAVPTLETLHASHHTIQAVVTVPDKQQGRGRKSRPSAVKETAMKLGLPVLQPEKLRDPEFAQQLRMLNPDLVVVVAFRILPEDIFTIPVLGSFNLHASLLPKYRGAAPIHWALLNGDKETGVTTFFLKRSVDTGNIITQSSIPIEQDDNLYSLYSKLCELGAGVVLDTVNMIASGSFEAGVQDNSLASPAPKVTTETRQLNFSESALQCHNRIRAFAPKPGAFTHRSGVSLKILTSAVVEGKGNPGEIIELSADSFTIACANLALQVHSVQPESKKAMDAASYLRGNPMRIGEQLG